MAERANWRGDVAGYGEISREAVVVIVTKQGLLGLATLSLWEECDELEPRNSSLVGYSLAARACLGLHINYDSSLIFIAKVANTYSYFCTICVGVCHSPANDPALLRPETRFIRGQSALSDLLRVISLGVCQWYLQMYMVIRLIPS